MKQSNRSDVFAEAQQVLIMPQASRLRCAALHVRDSDYGRSSSQEALANSNMPLQLDFAAETRYRIG